MAVLRASPQAHIALAKEPRRETMRYILLAAFTAIMLGFGVSTMVSAAGSSPWEHHVPQDNGQG